MPTFHAIAAMSENRVIGDRGKLPWHLPADYRWFKHKTMDGTVVMGRKTFDSIGRPLPGRRTIVLTRGGAAIPGVEISRDVGTLAPGPGICWVCGGAEIYRLLLPKCELLYLTRVKREATGDTFFPPFESEFRRDQVIHDAEAFRVERWVNTKLPDAAPPEPEKWPFS